MEKQGDIWLPETDEDAVRLAAKNILHAACLLDSAIDMTDPDSSAAEYYAYTAESLRDIADKLYPPRAEWPANVIPFIPRQA